MASRSARLAAALAVLALCWAACDRSVVVQMSSTTEDGGCEPGCFPSGAGCVCTGPSGGACTSDADCTGSEVCDTSAGICVEVFGTGGAGGAGGQTGFGGAGGAVGAGGAGGQTGAGGAGGAGAGGAGGVGGHKGTGGA